MQKIYGLAKSMSVPLIDLCSFFLDNRLAYDHLFEGWLPDGVTQTAMASLIAGEFLDILGVEGFPKPILCDYQRIYTDNQHVETMHNAFTDLTYFKGMFFIAFRTASTHASTSKGMIVVLKSRDGIHREKDAILGTANKDNRDPKFLNTGHKLFLYTPTISLME